MRRLATLGLAFALAAAAVLLTSCGGGGEAKLLPGATAREITENLDLVKQYAEEGECVSAADAVGEISTQVEALNGVDPKLKQALQRGAARLGEVIASCEETTEAEPPADETTTERSEPPGQEKKAEKEREKEEKANEKPEPPPASTETTPTEPPVPPGESGGTGAPGGVSPATPVGPGEE